MKGLSELRKVLLIKGVTQRELAKLSGLNVAVISQIATGRVIPTADERARISEILEESESELFGFALQMCNCPYCGHAISHSGFQGDEIANGVCLVCSSCGGVFRIYPYMGDVSKVVITKDGF